MKTEPELLEEYYSKKLYLSYSAINTLLHAPVLYYKKYVLQQREELVSPQLVEGKVTHCLLLDNGNFDKLFIISPDKLPTDSTKVVLDKVYTRAQSNGSHDLSLESLEEYLLEELITVNLHQSLKTDKQRLDKMLTEANTGYYSYLLKREGKTIIDQPTWLKCKENESVIRSHPEISLMLGLDSFQSQGLIISNETLLQCDPDNYLFGLKGIPDSVVIDPVNQIVNINDLKTTGKTIADFKESVEYYRYDLQAAIQKLIVWANYPQYHNYSWSFTFVVIDKYQQVYPFRVSDPTMSQWLTNLQEVLSDVEYHYKNKRYRLPRKYDSGEIVL